MNKTSILNFYNGLGGKISLPPMLAWLGLKTIGIPHPGTRIRLYLLSKALKDMGVKAATTILDAGCGYGFVSFTLGAKNFRVFGADNNLERLKVARFLSKVLDSKNVEFTYASIYKLPFKNKTFDVALCLEVLEHLKDDKTALKELKRVIKDKGKLIVSFPQYYADYDGYLKLGHLRAGYTLDFFKDMAKVVGFKINKVYPYNRSVVGKLASNMNFRLAQVSPIFTLIIFPITYFLLIIDRYLPFNNPSNYLIVLSKSLNQVKKR